MPHQLAVRIFSASTTNEVPDTQACRANSLPNWAHLLMLCQSNPVDDVAWTRPDHHLCTQLTDIHEACGILLFVLSAELVGTLLPPSSFKRVHRWLVAREGVLRAKARGPLPPPCHLLLRAAP